MLTLGDMPDGVMYVRDGTSIFLYRDFVVSAKTWEDADDLLRKYISNIEGLIRFLKIDSEGESLEYTKANVNEIDRWEKIHQEDRVQPGSWGSDKGLGDLACT